MNHLPAGRGNDSQQLSVCLALSGFRTIKFVLRNFGVKSLQELADRLGELGLVLIQSGELTANSTEAEVETEEENS